MAKKHEKVGLWIIGASGGVGSTVALGVAALRRHLLPGTGLVTSQSLFEPARLVDPGSIVIGGHEIRSESLLDAVKGVHRRAGLFTAELIEATAPQLRAFQRNILPGTLCGAGSTIRRFADSSLALEDRSPAAALERIAHDIAAFRRRKRLDHVVVMHLASSEPPAPKAAAHASLKRLKCAMSRPGSRTVPTSSIYALAAVESGCAFVNFTPSPGISIPAIRRRAEELGVPYMGNDGKTGETLVKSVLAPMFAMRNLQVLSWVGQNILGNRDGAVLNEPQTRLSKLRSKDKTVAQILGPEPTTHVSIDYVPSLDDWKVAWDFIHFEGFLGTKMRMQFTWEGSDSALAAPLVIDLARLAAWECREERGGPMRHLACFFKDPIAVKEQDLFTQWQRLVEHVTRYAAGT